MKESVHMKNARFNALCIEAIAYQGCKATGHIGVIESPHWRDVTL
jgi:hypothetical protein